MHIPHNHITLLKQYPSTGQKKKTKKEKDEALTKAEIEAKKTQVDTVGTVKALEKALGKKAKMNMKPMQPGDVPNTFANVDDLIKNFNYKPKTSVDEGVANFVDWYLKYEGSFK